MRSKIITLSMPEPFLRSVDRAARRERRTRSELAREAMRQYLRSAARWHQLRVWGRDTARRFNIRDEEDVYRLMEGWRHGSRDTKRRHAPRRRS